MNRRSLFKLIGGALCAASIELTGVVPEIKRVLMSIDPPFIKGGNCFFMAMYTSPKDLKDLGRWKPLVAPRFNFVNGEWVKVPDALPSSPQSPAPSPDGL